MTKRKRKLTGWRPQDDKLEETFKKIVLQKGNEESVKSLATVQENIESAAKGQLQEKDAAES